MSAGSICFMVSPNASMFIYLFLSSCLVSSLRVWYWKSPSITVLGLIWNLTSSSICFMKPGAPVFGVYTLRIVILMAVSLSIKQPSLSLLTHFLSLMADIRMTMLTYFLVPFTWNVFFHSFISRVVSIFDIELYFLEATKIWSWSLIKFLVYLLIGELR